MICRRFPESSISCPGMLVVLAALPLALVPSAFGPSASARNGPPRLLRDVSMGVDAPSKAPDVAPATSVNELFGSVVPTQDAAARPSVQRVELDPWREYEGLRGDNFDLAELKAFFAGKPQVIAARLLKIVTTVKSAKDDCDAKADTGLAAGEKSADFNPTEDVRDTGPAAGRGKDLCEAMASLGPVSVKISQTLSQRPDLVGDEASTALKRLQTSNVPYANELAWAVLKESLGWTGPIAPGIGVDEGTAPDAPTLFKAITPDPVAVASLGQVYKATTHEGVDVAVKVQRPDALQILAQDYLCFVVTWAAIEKYWELTGGFDNGDIRSVVNRVAGEVLNELDYYKEAQNGKVFEASLEFLGFVGEASITTTLPSHCRASGVVPSPAVGLVITCTSPSPRHHIRNTRTHASPGVCPRSRHAGRRAHVLDQPRPRHRVGAGRPSLSADACA